MVFSKKTRIQVLSSITGDATRHNTPRTLPRDFSVQEIGTTALKVITTVLVVGSVARGLNAVADHSSRDNPRTVLVRHHRTC